MTGRERKEAARARLRRNYGAAGDDDRALVGRAMSAVSEAVENREPLSDDQASREVVSEVRKMRAEKRARTFVRTARG